MYTILYIFCEISPLQLIFLINPKRYVTLNTTSDQSLVSMKVSATSAIQSLLYWLRRPATWPRKDTWNPYKKSLAHGILSQDYLKLLFIWPIYYILCFFFFCKSTNSYLNNCVVVLKPTQRIHTCEISWKINLET